MPQRRRDANFSIVSGRYLYDALLMDSDHRDFIKSEHLTNFGLNAYVYFV